MSRTYAVRVHNALEDRGEFIGFKISRWRGPGWQLVNFSDRQWHGACGGVSTAALKNKEEQRNNTSGMSIRRRVFFNFIFVVVVVVKVVVVVPPHSNTRRTPFVKQKKIPKYKILVPPASPNLFHLTLRQRS